MIAVSMLSKGLNADLRVRVLVVLGALSIGFILFLLTTSNPFARQFEVLNSQGRDLNPLLQDPVFLSILLCCIWVMWVFQWLCFCNCSSLVGQD